MMDLARIGKLHLGMVAAAGMLAYAARWGDPGSLVLGGAVMGANFWLLRIVSSMLCASAAGGSSRAMLGVLAVVAKFGLLLGLLAMLFVRLPIEGMSFACGVTVLLVACVLEALRHEMAARKGVA
jgi:hypothetical protein